MPIKIDKHGYVTPHKAVSATVEELKETFVDRFPDATERIKIFEGYLKCCDILVSLIGTHIQWVDGSFTSGKAKPNDIDVLCFVSYDQPKEVFHELKSLMTRSREEFGVDLYVIQMYPVDHSMHRIFKIDKVEWINQFTKTRKMGHRKTQYNKGFLELKIS